MDFLAWLLLGAGAFLIYAAITGRNPLTLLQKGLSKS